MHMTKDELVKGLNEDLAGEFQAVIMYVTYAATVTGFPARCPRDGVIGHPG